MSIEKQLDSEYNKLKQQFVQDYPTCTKRDLQFKDNMQNNSELLNNDNINQVCLVGNAEVPCVVHESVNDYHTFVNKSKFVNRWKTEQLHDNNYHNVYINRTYQDNKSCRMRGTNQHIWLDDKQYGPNLGIDSNGYCILRGTNIG